MVCRSGHGGENVPSTLAKVSMYLYGACGQHATCTNICDQSIRHFKVYLHTPVKARDCIIALELCLGSATRFTGLDCLGGGIEPS